jgi:hypothetical protein
MKPETETVDITPSWGFAAQVIAAALEDGTAEGKRLAREELFRMAKALDAQNAKA